MAKNWWKYGLCVFGGLGVGYLVGVKITKDKAEAEYDQKIEDIREVYRNSRKAKAPKKKPDVEMERPEVTTKTSIQMEKLSEKKDKAEKATKRYSGNYDEPKDEPEETPEEEEKSENWEDYIHIVDEFPEDSDYRSEVLDYYSDGVLAYDVTGQKIADEDIPHLVSEEALKRLEADDCNEVFVANDLYRINYTIIFRYQEYAEVLEEEPYKASL